MPEGFLAVENLQTWAGKKIGEKKRENTRVPGGFWRACSWGLWVVPCV